MIPQPSAINYISIEKAKDEIAEGMPIVDVRIPEAYGESHIAGAENICVYEVSFCEKFANRFPKKETKIILYGESDQFRAAEMAFGRLKDLGYFWIIVLEGGLDAWMRAGLDLESGRPDLGPVYSAGELNLSPEKSALRWTGRATVASSVGCI